MPTIGTPMMWATFLAGVVAVLAIDLGIVNRTAHVIRAREAALWTLFFISLSGLFAGWLFWRFGARIGLEFVTGYLIEYALSVDNLFVFLVVFSYFGVPPALRHRVLFWGILGALFMRAAFILAGTALITRFHWTIYIFGVFLLFTGLKLLVAGEAQIDPEKNPMLGLVRRFLPVTSAYHGQRFLVRIDGRRYATPLFLVLVVIEATDVVFAVDSIPAIFGITRDPFLVFTSNIFAILGLRALFFLLADFMDRFHYLGTGLGLVLAFIGVKMLVSGVYHVPIGFSLGVIATLLVGSVVASLLFPKRSAEAADGPQLPEK